MRYLVKYYYRAVKYLVKYFYDGKFVQISWKWKVRYLVKYYHQAVVQTFYAENTAEWQPQLVRSMGPFWWCWWWWWKSNIMILIVSLLHDLPQYPLLKSWVALSSQGCLVVRYPCHPIYLLLLMVWTMRIIYFLKAHWSHLWPTRPSQPTPNSPNLTKMSHGKYAYVYVLKCSSVNKDLTSIPNLSASPILSIASKWQGHDQMHRLKVRIAVGNKTDHRSHSTAAAPESTYAALKLTVQSLLTLYLHFSYSFQVTRSCSDASPHN